MLDYYHLSFQRNVVLTNENEESIILSTNQRKLKLNCISPGIRLVINKLFKQSTSVKELSDLILETDGENSLTIWYFWQQKLLSNGFLDLILKHQEIPIIQLKTINPECNFININEDKQYIISKFTYFRKDTAYTNGWIAVTPLSSFETILFNEGITWITSSNPSISVKKIMEYNQEITKEFAICYLTLLLTAGILLETSSSLSELENQAELAYWEFHDLLFHSRSRLGRHDKPYGGTYRFMNKTEPEPAIKKRMSDDIISLYKPDLEEVTKNDFSFTYVLEQRHSVRHYDNNPITIKQLGEFLFRCARVKRINHKDTIMPYEITSRPYPNGGAVYEFEIYVIINKCEGIEDGMYHYEPHSHVLCRLQVDLLNCSNYVHRTSLGSDEIPQILITFTSRFKRVSWKYQSMAYALTLKNVGALYQTMYLVATSMGLAPCGLGGGDSELFANISGVNFYSEPAVGEFALGSYPKNNL
ncbi:SagB family peptide dehydrogenase [Bacillus thuringiensis]|uniref:SagB/ThcOx family dehydrogenase n=1 Tax=Bacillus thuringiensis TaxID=1428 RepID=A0AAW4HYN6_BACTU|nr:SagB family peptide dehydrogenase [Bacillus thuringiensis]MBN9901099.1 SagB/ThcOx family dehydrogenase [Bacillus thuringiensis]MDY7522183.1 SagB family peptide dehydrogenase [Bacillus thuringiensis]